MEHGEEEPNFVMRVVKNHRSALSRQIGEAVRIMRRGGEGSILNSKSEFDRCKIPRLIVEEEDLEQIEREQKEELETRQKEIEEQAEVWQSSAYEKRREDDRKNWKVRKTSQEGTKRPKKLQKTEGKRHKKRKYDLLPEVDGEPAPPASQNSLCKTTKRGRCDVHDCEMTKSKISTQK